MRKLAIASAIAAATLALAAFAQPHPGEKTAPTPAPRFTERTTPGWSLMTSGERAAHKEKMRAFKSYDECEAYMVEHHKQMEERAKEKGKTIAKGPGPGCNWLKK